MPGSFFPRSRGVFLDGWRPFGWLCLAVFLLYSKTLAFQFTMYDDGKLIVDNLPFLGDIRNALTLFTVNVQYPAVQDIYYRPLLVLSFMADALLGGANPSVYHATNILLHAGVACLLFVLLKRLSFPPGRSFVFALVFAVHPALSQAVAWVPGRNDSLLAVFALSSLIFLSRLEETGSLRDAVLHLLSFAAALLTKETAVVLVPLFVAYRYLASSRPLAAGKTAALAAGWSILVAVWAAARSHAVGGISGAVTIQFTDILKNLPFIFVHLGKVFFPFNQSVIPVMRDATLLYGAAAAVLLAAVLFRSKGGRPGVMAFGAGWFIFFLLPTLMPSGAAPVYYIFEHRLYCAVPGLLLILMESSVVRGFSGEGRKNAAFAVAAVVIAAFSVKTFLYTDVFMNKQRFWDNAARYAPSSPMVQKNRARLYFEAGDEAKARGIFEKLLALPAADPDACATAHQYIGIMAMRGGDNAAAAREFMAGRALQPDNGAIASNLAIALYRLGEKNEASRLWVEALRSSKDPLPILSNLSLMCYKEKDFRGAARYARMIRQSGGTVPPDIAAALEGRGLVY